MPYTEASSRITRGYYGVGPLVRSTVSHKVYLTIYVYLLSYIKSKAVPGLN
jgi:hypothetical protein